MENQDHKENKPPNTCVKSNVTEKVVLLENGEKKITKVDESVGSRFMTAGMSCIVPDAGK